jgi:hypothetical protein
MIQQPQPRWNGEPCQARRVTAVVADSIFFPLYWAREFVGTRRKAVEVTYGGRTFYLDDEDGSGWAKVTAGGSPAHSHRGLNVDPDSIRLRVDPDRPCLHEDFDAFVGVGRITASETDPTVIGYSAEIRVNCRACGEPFRWTGVPAGLSPRQPMCSVDETELRAPLRPASADPDFGLGLPGFSVNHRKDG